MTYADTSDVSARLGRALDDQEALIVGIRLEDVERLIKAKIPDLDGMVLDEEIDEGTLIMVEAEAILRLIRNQDGYSTETDGNYTYSISSRVASGVLEILDDEWALLGVTHGSFVIAPKVMFWNRPYFPPAWYSDEYKALHPAVWWGDEGETQ